jgi:hypothetical protein
MTLNYQKITFFVVRGICSVLASFLTLAGIQPQLFRSQLLAVGQLWDGGHSGRKIISVRIEEQESSSPFGSRVRKAVMVGSSLGPLKLFPIAAPQ